jgi:hypothetical protein
LLTWHNYALALSGNGNSAQAEEEYRAVLKIEERVLGPEHPWALKTRMNLANTLNEQGKSAEAEAAHRAVLLIKERVLGPEHPETLKNRINLAYALNGQRKFKEAEGELRAVLTIQEPILGPEHPDTLLSIDTLAFNLQQQDKLGEARVLARRALEGRRRILGAAHPQTKSTEKLCESLAIPNVTLPALAGATPEGEPSILAAIPATGRADSRVASSEPPANAPTPAIPPIAAAAVPATAQEPAPASPKKFFFDYAGKNSPGRRIWTMIDKDTWTEEYDSGTVVSKIAGDLALTGAANDDSFRVFIPDIGSPRMRIWVRTKNKTNGEWGEWKYLPDMQGVQ